MKTKSLWTRYGVAVSPEPAPGPGRDVAGEESGVASGSDFTCRDGLLSIQRFNSPNKPFCPTDEVYAQHLLETRQRGGFRCIPSA